MRGKGLVSTFTDVCTGCFAVKWAGLRGYLHVYIQVTVYQDVGIADQQKARKQGRDDSITQFSILPYFHDMCCVIENEMWVRVRGGGGLILN